MSTNDAQTKHVDDTASEGGRGKRKVNPPKPLTYDTPGGPARQSTKKEERKGSRASSTGTDPASCNDVMPEGAAAPPQQEVQDQQHAHEDQVRTEGEKAPVTDTSMEEHDEPPTTGNDGQEPVDVQQVVKKFTALTTKINRKMKGWYEDCMTAIAQAEEQIEANELTVREDIRRHERNHATLSDVVDDHGRKIAEWITDKHQLEQHQARDTTRITDLEARMDYVQAKDADTERQLEEARADARQDKEALDQETTHLGLKIDNLADQVGSISEGAARRVFKEMIDQDEWITDRTIMLMSARAEATCKNVMATHDFEQRVREVVNENGKSFLPGEASPDVDDACSHAPFDNIRECTPFPPVEERQTHRRPAPSVLNSEVGEDRFESIQREVQELKEQLLRGKKSPPTGKADQLWDAHTQNKSGARGWRDTKDAWSRYGSREDVGIVQGGGYVSQKLMDPNPTRRGGGGGPPSYATDDDRHPGGGRLARPPKMRTPAFKGAEDDDWDFFQQNFEFAMKQQHVEVEDWGYMLMGRLEGDAAKLAKAYTSHLEAGEAASYETLARYMADNYGTEVNPARYERQVDEFEIAPGESFRAAARRLQTAAALANPRVPVVHPEEQRKLSGIFARAITDKDVGDVVLAADKPTLDAVVEMADRMTLEITKRRERAALMQIRSKEKEKENQSADTHARSGKGNAAKDKSTGVRSVQGNYRQGPPRQGQMNNQQQQANHSRARSKRHQCSSSISARINTTTEETDVRGTGTTRAGVINCAFGAGNQDTVQENARILRSRRSKPTDSEPRLKEGTRRTKGLRRMRKTRRPSSRLRHRERTRETNGGQPSAGRTTC